MDTPSRRKPPIITLTIAFSILCLSLLTFIFTEIKPNITVANAATTPAPTDVVSNLTMPTAFAWLPDNSMLITEKGGRLVRFTNNQTQTITTIPVSTLSERGLLGITIDPEFNTNRYIYLFYTTTNAVNRVVRYTLNTNYQIGNETILVDNIFSSSQGNHNAGDMHFDTNRNLYISTGDGGGANNCGGCSQKIDSPNGKILRIDPDTGEGVEGNPFLSNPNTTAKKVWALGLRNPYRFDIDLNTNKLYVADVGENRYEEINEGIAGANYGWPRVEGPEPTNLEGMTYPLFYYSRSGNTNPSFNNCSSITGGAFARGTNLPSDLSNNYFFGDYTCGKIWTMNPSNPSSATLYASNVGAPVHIAFGPEGALYYADIANGKIKKFSYSSQTLAPTIKPSASPTATPSPTAAPNTPPQITITGKENNAKVLPGATVQLQATATDTQGGTISSENISWNVLRHHGTTHTHPWAQETGNTLSFTVPQPEDLETAGTSFIEVIVKAKDARNAENTQTLKLIYDTVPITFNSAPQGMKVKLNNLEYTTPTTLDAVKGQQFTVETNDQLKDNVQYRFVNWSNNNERNHTYSTPNEPATLSATFTQVVATPSVNPTPTPSIRPSNSPTPTPTASPILPTATPNSTPNVTPNATQTPIPITTQNPTTTPSPTPIETIQPVETQSPIPQPTGEPTPISTAEPSPFPTDQAIQTRLILCTFEDKNKNGIRNWGDNAESWTYKIRYTNEERTVESHGWHFWSQGCVKTKVPVNTEITVEQEEKENWIMTALYADGARTEPGSYTYISDIDEVKVLWFLNTNSPQPAQTPEPSPSPTETPNSSATSLEIFAEGQQGGGENPSLQILIEDAVVAQIDNISTYTRYTYTHPENINIEDVKIQFINDYHVAEPYDDRNLRIDKITLDGVIYEAEDQNTFATGIWSTTDGCTPGNKQSEWLSCNGYMQFKGTL